jgi:hypothetical protein
MRHWRAQADRVHFSGSDSAVFQAYRELIEELASDALILRDLSTIMGRVLVTSEALTRITRSA